MKVIPTDIRWYADLPIFASESFLKAVGDDYGWLGGYDDSGELLCTLPYTIIQKPLLRMVRFRVETVPNGELTILQEKEFLNRVVDYFSIRGVDIIIPASNNTLFRTFPDGADAAPYGSYIIDLNQTEEQIWQNMNKKVRQNINSARRNGIVVQKDVQKLDAAYALIRDTFKRSKLPFMNFKSFERLIDGLGSYCKVMSAEFRGAVQSYIVFAFSNYSAYAIYAGNIPGQKQGAIKYLLWEAMRTFKRIGIQRFDFFGSRVYPEEGSKQAQLATFKSRFGALLKTGYMWKIPLNPQKYMLYTLARRIRSGGDVVDAERHKLAQFMLENSPEFYHNKAILK